MSMINFQTKIVDLITQMTNADSRKSAELASLRSHVTSAMTDADKHHQRKLASLRPQILDEIALLKSQVSCLSAKQDQIVIKQYQIQCTLNNNNVTPPMSNPLAISHISFLKFRSSNATIPQPGTVPGMYDTCLFTSSNILQ